MSDTQEREKSNGSSSEGEDGEEYEVEAIRDKRETEAGVFYEVKWVGWESDTNTWEPYDTLREDCPEILEKFERNLKRKREERKRERLERMKEAKERSRKEGRIKRRLSSSSSSSDSEQERQAEKSRKSSVDSKDDRKSSFKDHKSEKKYSDSRSEKERERKSEKKIESSKTDSVVKSKDKSSDSKIIKSGKAPLKDVEKIVGITKDERNNNELYFAVRLKGEDDLRLVKSDVAYKVFPYMCCKYYESNVLFQNS